MVNAVRACGREDISEVADLYLRAFRKGRPPASPALRGQFEQLYFDNPWYDDEIPSLVVERAGGGVAGFLGVITMPMRIGGRSVRTAIGGNLMIDPELGDPLAAARLLRRYFEGKQDLALTDSASSEARTMWEGLGASTAMFHSTRWLLLLRPTAASIGILGGNGRSKRLASIVAVAARPIDVLATRRLTRAVASDAVKLQPIRVADLHAFLTSLDPRRHVLFGGSPDDLGWLIEQARAKAQFGPLRLLAAHRDAGPPFGVVAYYPNKGGIGQVLLLAARPGLHGALLDAVRADAVDAGSTALMGQGDPQLAVHLGDRPSVYVQRNEFVTLKSSDPSLVAPIAAAQVSLGRLFGEWWTRLQGDSFDS